MVRHYRTVAFAALAALVSFNLRAEVVEIGSAADFAEKIAANPEGDYKLTADIDLADAEYVTIPEFSGTLDGGGNTISGLTVPLFGTVSGSAQIRNIVFDGANVANTTASTDSGILAVKMDGENFVVDSISFINCTIIKGSSGNAGMIAGTLTKSGTISNCSIADSCKMTASGNCGALGGFVGTATADGQNATIAFLNCVNFCTTLSRDYTAKYAGIICNATAKGSGGSADQRAHLVFADCTNYVGAVGKFTNPNYGAFAFSVNGGASSNMGDVLFERCANYGELDITGTKTAVGGFIVTGGNAQYTFVDCVNYANIKTVTAVPAGGFIGTLSALIKVPLTFKGCANLGDVSGNDAGGFIGNLAHNASYGSNKVVFESCLQKGEITATRETSVGAQLIGYLSSSVTYPYLGVKGSLLMNETLVGGNAGGSFGTEDFADNVFADVSEGLVDGTDLAALNAYGEGCNLWKPGSKSPILKIMPDEPAPDVVTVRFLEAEAFGSSVLKTCVILKGATPVAPVLPGTVCSGSGKGGKGGGGGGGQKGVGPGAGGAAGTFSKNWYQEADGRWRIKNKAGQIVKSAWLCDDAVAANGQNVWYLLDANGDMVTGGLVQDNTGNFYSLEMNHNGYYGMLRYKNGTYTCEDGTTVYLEFSQEHNGSFGAVINPAGLEFLKAKYGITKFTIGNENIQNTKSFE